MTAVGSAQATIQRLRIQNYRVLRATARLPTTTVVPFGCRADVAGGGSAAES